MLEKFLSISNCDMIIEVDFLIVKNTEIFFHWLVNRLVGPVHWQKVIQRFWSDNCYKESKIQIYNLKDTINPMCPVNYGIEDTEHFFCCSAILSESTDVNDVLKACGHSEGAQINMLQLLLYGNNNLPLKPTIIFNLTIKYISEL